MAVSYSTPRRLCVLCGSAVYLFLHRVHRGDAEYAEQPQRNLQSRTYRLTSEPRVLNWKMCHNLQPGGVQIDGTVSRRQLYYSTSSQILNLSAFFRYSFSGTFASGKVLW